VQRTFRFQVRANDAVSPEYEVQVLPPPHLVALDDKPSPQVRLHYPAYTGLPSPEALSPGMGDIEAVAGTHVVLRARADRPLARAWIEFRPGEPLAILSAFLASLGAGDVLAALTLDQGGRSVWEEVPAVLEGDRSTFHVAFTPRVNGFYVLHIEDDSGLHHQRLFPLRINSDPAPTVRMDRPSSSRDVLTVLPTAVLNLEVVVEDPQYAVRSVFLEYQTDRSGPARRLYVYDPREAPGRQTAVWAGAGTLAVTPRTLRPVRLEFKQLLSLARIKHPDGNRGLEEGDVLLLQACADDYDDVSVNKGPGRSHQVEIRMVGRNALELVLNQEQARVQQELLRLREKEREALAKVTEAESRLRKGEKLGPDDLDKLVQAEQIQQQIRERVGDRDKEGLLAEVQRIQETLKQNGMENTAIRDRMHDVGRELDRLARNELPRIEPGLTEARKLAELLDEKTAADRKAQLEQQAREAEREAKAAEEAAEKKKAEAARAEKAAEESPDPADKARHAQEARRQRERAEELKQEARDKRQQAERERREAAAGLDANQPRQALAQARKGQEEVEKTLNDLLTRMEPWSTTREIKGEASRLLEEQKQLQADVEKLNQDTGGKSKEELTPKEQAELDNLKEAQERLQERTRQLLSKMERVAREREAKDPQMARELSGALNEAKQSDIDGKMAEARKELDQNHLNDAVEKQKDSVAGLQKLVKNLEDRREEELDRLAKKMRQAEKKLAELIEEQERLQKKVKEAKAIPNAAQREAALKALAGEQQRLQKKTREMMEEVARLRAGRASHELGKANEQMDDALQQLSRAEEADQKQEDVLDRLDEALEELEEARKQTEEHLAREQLTNLAEALKRHKERQESIKDETEALQKRVLQSKGWTRGQLGSLLKQKGAEDGLAGETEKDGKKLTGAPVFARQVRNAAEAMKQAGMRADAMLKEVKADHEAGRKPDLTRLPDAELGRAQGEAVRRLAQLLDAIKTAAEAPPRAARRQGGGGGGGGEGGGGAPNAGDGIPPVAQYKLLRDMQAEINKKTEDFRKDHPDPDKLDAKDKAELQSLQKDQREVAELLDQLNRTPADGDPGAGNGREGEKK
jgi:colicin import membrane protein